MTGDTIGGVVRQSSEVFQLVSVPYVQWDRKLDARWLRQLSLSNAFKGDWNLVSAGWIYPKRVARLWMKFSGPKGTAIHVVPII